jgi:uncharacterized protein (DUF1778 family)
MNRSPVASRDQISRRLPASERRSRTLVVRCTEAEGDLIEEAAQGLGCSLSDLVRDAVVARARQEVNA